MVVVEQDMAVVENLSRWSFSSYVMMSLRALYNCDKIRKFLGDIRKNNGGLIGLLLGRLGETILGRVVPGYYPIPVCLGRVWHTAMSHGCA
ncbi:hypothetical protein GOBAR_AA34008 [Gossypium barbadense]|uniref:Uncharacterized protein n=1 Tax=Gossypium barbadense TaxID=3634 RepID=A0A2P5W6G7_GOSBA|nr:hypothetical protein GOBAR_AA34008 [Gossypium barbadense]